MARLTRDDWVDAGLALLRDEGDAALTIDRLASRVERTKGSFYHHFDDIGALRRALLDAWSERNTLAPIAAADRDAKHRRARLYAAVSTLDHRVEVAMRSWAARDDEARAARDAIDARRVDYLASLWTGAHAHDFAEIEYATFLGLLERYRERYIEKTAPLTLLVRVLEAATKRGAPARSSKRGGSSK